MVMESMVASEAEIAAAAQDAAEHAARQDVQPGQGVSEGNTLPGTVRPLTYSIPASDQGAWVLVWELELDRDGNEYGRPTRAPRGQLGLWLQKRRGDGGQRFITNQPARIAAEPQYPCLHEQCRKRTYTRQDLVDHVESVHPREARMYRSLLDEIMAKAAQDNPRIMEIARTIANTKEAGLRSVAVNAPAKEERPDLDLGTPVVTRIGVANPGAEPEEQIHYCRFRSNGCSRFFDTVKGENVHATTQCKHKGG